MKLDFEVAAKMQEICIGGEAELTKGEIAGQVIDLDKEIKNARQIKIDKCTAYYEKLVNDDTKQVYNIDTLTEEIERIKKDFNEFYINDNEKSYFNTMNDCIEEFFMNWPLEGLDSVAYGIVEVCVFSYLEYACWKFNGYNHEWHREEYADSITRRTAGKEVSDHWMKLYDLLQSKFDGFGGKTDTPYERRQFLLACSYVTALAIGNQNEVAIDRNCQDAMEIAKNIGDEIDNDKYIPDLDINVDNAMKLYNFVYQNFLANPEA